MIDAKRIICSLDNNTSVSLCLYQLFRNVKWLQAIPLDNPIAAKVLESQKVMRRCKNMISVTEISGGN